MTSYLVSFSPDIIILGGDTVYDDGMRSCYNSWDEFYTMFEDINSKLNRIVPFVMAVGNHDVGFDAVT
jgi:predicted MPP superfamily phosphohydrolase